MDFSCFSYLLTQHYKNRKYVKELSLSFLEMKTKLKKFLLVRFLLMFLFRLIVERLRIFRPHCNISANTQDYELRISIHINFDTLMSNLKSYFQYEIVMMSL